MKEIKVSDGDKEIRASEDFTIFLQSKSIRTTREVRN